MVTKILLVSLLGGILGLDRVVLQVMVSRPIVSAPLIGLILGDVHTGLTVGALLELFWVDKLALGAFLPPNDFLTAVVIAAVSILAGSKLGNVSRELIAFSFLLFLPTAYLGKWVDSVIIRSNSVHSEKAKTFLATLVMLPFFLSLGTYGMALVFPNLPSSFLRALSFVYFTLPVIGVAAGLYTLKLKRAIPLFCAVFLTLSTLGELFYG